MRDIITLICLKVRECYSHLSIMKSINKQDQGTFYNFVFLGGHLSTISQSIIIWFKFVITQIDLVLIF